MKLIFERQKRSSRFREWESKNEIWIGIGKLKIRVHLVMEGEDCKKVLKNINGKVLWKEKISLDFLERTGFGFHVFGLLHIFSFLRREVYNV